MYDTTRPYNLLEGRNQVFIIFYHLLVLNMLPGSPSASSTNFDATEIILILFYVQSWSTWDPKWNLWDSLQFEEMLDIEIDGN